MNSSTFIEPAFETDRTSFLPRSTSITCSALSLSSSSIFAARRSSSSRLPPRGHVPAMGFVVTTRSQRLKRVSGDAPTREWSPNSKM